MDSLKEASDATLTYLHLAGLEMKGDAAAKLGSLFMVRSSKVETLILEDVLQTASAVKKSLGEVERARFMPVLKKFEIRSSEMTGEQLAHISGKILEMAPNFETVKFWTNVDVVQEPDV